MKTVSTSLAFLRGSLSREDGPGTHHRSGQASESMHTLQCTDPDSLQQPEGGEGRTEREK